MLFKRKLSCQDKILRLDISIKENTKLSKQKNYDVLQKNMLSKKKFSNNLVTQYSPQWVINKILSHLRLNNMDEFYNFPFFPYYLIYSYF